eukprot:scaffold13628_cov81-Phaeocystis_antarctica.AAC.1
MTPVTCPPALSPRAEPEVERDMRGKSLHVTLRCHGLCSGCTQRVQVGLVGAMTPVTCPPALSPRAEPEVERDMRGKSLHVTLRYHGLCSGCTQRVQ